MATLPRDLKLSPVLVGRDVCSHDQIVIGTIVHVFTHAITVQASNGKSVIIGVSCIDTNSLNDPAVTLFMDVTDFYRRLTEMNAG